MVGEGEGVRPGLEKCLGGKLMGADVVVYGGECKSASKHGRGKHCDRVVIIMAGVEKQVTGECISFVGCPWEVHKDVVVVCQTRDILCHTAIDILGVSVEFKIFVVGEYSDRVCCTH